MTIACVTWGASSCPRGVSCSGGTTAAPVPAFSGQFCSAIILALINSWPFAVASIFIAAFQQFMRCARIELQLGVGSNYCGGAISSSHGLPLITNSKHEVRIQFMCISDEIPKPDQMARQFWPAQKLNWKYPARGGVGVVRRIEKGHEKAFQFA